MQQEARQWLYYKKFWCSRYRIEAYNEPEDYASPLQSPAGRLRSGPSRGIQLTFVSVNSATTILHCSWRIPLCSLQCEQHPLWQMCNPPVRVYDIAMLGMQIGLANGTLRLVIFAT